MTPVAERVAGLDWDRIAADLDALGCAATGPVLTPAECGALASGFETDTAFRNRVVMARHGYGSGEYRYFAYPLPEPVATLRTELYARLAGIANGWEAALGGARDFPASHPEFTEACHAAGQTRPTPLLLRYGPGDYNRLHQDLYGELAFPLQVVFLLSRPDEDFAGGAFVLTEQRARIQSRAEVVALRQGEAVVFAVNHRPVRGARGVQRASMRHGVSRVLSGQRFTLGVIFHDAR